MAKRVPPTGPAHADLLIVGEAPGFDEELQGTPFIGTSGRLLRALLHAADINPADARITNVCQFKPPGNKIDEWLVKTKKKAKEEGYTHFQNGRFCSPEILDGLDKLEMEILECKPKVIMAVGGTALWALTGKLAITDWRGSELHGEFFGHECTVIPVYHPAAVLRMWSWKSTLQHDIRARVARNLREGYAPPNYEALIEPTFKEAVKFLTDIKPDQWVVTDVETKGSAIIDCIGIATSKSRAMCIPIIKADGTHYWDQADEFTILGLIEKVLERARVCMQNGNYDRQFFNRCYGWKVRRDFDTLTAQHVMFPGTQKSLDYLASLYCDRYRFWKNDSKDNPTDNLVRWRYNATDCCATFEVMEGQMAGLEETGMEERFQEQLGSGDVALNAMFRGIRFNEAKRKGIDKQLTIAITEREQMLAEVAEIPYVPGKFTLPRSSKQMGLLFDKMHLPKPRIRKGDGVFGDTFADEYLEEVAGRYPEHEGWISAVREIRSMGTLRANFVRKGLDIDGRFRSNLATEGTETFRLASSENVFGTGSNIQNVTDGSSSPTGLRMPNLREIIIPDPGYMIFEADLERADLQVVAAEANDEILLSRLAAHAKIHHENACDLYGLPGIDHVTDAQKRLAKVFCHATDYYAKPPTISKKCGVTVREAERLQARWFDIHPGIKEWHDRTRAQLEDNRTIYNKFGFRRVYFDRIDDRILSQALAWKPQSTVAIVINRAWRRIEAEEPRAQVLFQAHDSLVFQILIEEAEEVLARIAPMFLVPIPYPRPLIIGSELKGSKDSWGACVGREWPRPSAV